MDVTGYPFSELKNLFEHGSPLFLPVNPVEYHGPHLSLANDFVIARGVSKTFFELSLKPLNPKWEYLEAAPIHLGVDPAAGPGSQYTSMRDLTAILTEVGKRYAKLGCKKIVVATFHGAPAHNAAIEHAMENWEKVGIRSMNLMAVVLERAIEETQQEKEEILALIPDQKMRDMARDRLDGDFHGGFFETSLALRFAPETVSKNYTDIEPCPKLVLSDTQKKVLKGLVQFGFHRKAKEMEFAFLGLNWMKIKPFPGYSGHPAASSAAAGEMLFKKILPYYAAEARRVFDEGRSRTKPVLAWVTKLTHGA